MTTSSHDGDNVGGARLLQIKEKGEEEREKEKRREEEEKVEKHRR